MPGLIKSQALPDEENPVEDKAEGGVEEPQDQQVPEQESPPEDAAEGSEEPGEITPQAMRAKMTLPPQLKDAYERVVLAGMKIMFDPSTHQMAMKTLAGDGPIDERLAKGIAALMGTLIKESNGTMPPPVVIPAGIELIAAAGDFLKKSGEQITDDDIAGAMADFVQIIFQQGGAKKPEDMRAMLASAVAGGKAPQGPSPAAGPQAPAEPPQGLIAQQGA
jgi:hypothetical protein